MTIAPCDAGTCRIAQAVNSGKPTITPAATTAIRGSSARPGHGERVASSTAAASTAATTARPRPTRTGSRPATASRVAGSVRLKQATPSRPNSRPRRRSAGLAAGLEVAFAVGQDIAGCYLKGLGRLKM